MVHGEISLTAAETRIGDVAPLGAPDGVLNAADLVVLMRAIQGLVTLPDVNPGPEPPALNPVGAATNLNPYTITGSASADRLVADGLHLAVMRKQAAVANILLAREIDLNQKVHGNYLLDTAVRNDDLEMVRLLVAHGADPDIPGRHGSPRENARQNRQGDIEAILDAVPERGPAAPAR